ncbi:hypothetical protein Tco_1436203, partial [Tanacetum coccineum]
MKGKRKCEDLDKGHRLGNGDVFGNEEWNGGLGSTSGRQRSRRAFLCNRPGFGSASEVSDTDVGNMASYTSGCADGGILLDFEQTSMQALSNRQRGPRYSRDYTYECLFRQSGSVASQGESSSGNDVGPQHLRSPNNPIETSLVNYSANNQHAHPWSVMNGPFILDFEKREICSVSTPDVPCSLHIASHPCMSNVN